MVELQGFEREKLRLLGWRLFRHTAVTGPA
jgi:hypothetical protein